MRAVNWILTGGSGNYEEIYENLNWIEVYHIQQHQIHMEVKQFGHCFLWAWQFLKYLAQENPAILDPLRPAKAKPFVEIRRW